jgi:hypothetical protein
LERRENFDEKTNLLLTVMIYEGYSMSVKGPKKGYATIDEYIAAFPKDVQVILESIRQVIRKSAPGSEERISYGIPTFSLPYILEKRQKRDKNN